MWRYSKDPIDRYRRTLSLVALLVKNPILSQDSLDLVISLLVLSIYSYIGHLSVHLLILYVHLSVSSVHLLILYVH